ncbi:unnamed protein product [Spirodela intermedia]|uniref:Uncharacterized protein n=1 Tax=Spirodela intermedia TaxID=51605 RepID=A0ABN7ECD2_SPIIN|nr:unnamed protein product [Spirodela intermedia]
MQVSCSVTYAGMAPAIVSSSENSWLKCSNPCWS